jgi:hypothetical protein
LGFLNLGLLRPRFSKNCSLWAGVRVDISSAKKKRRLVIKKINNKGEIVKKSERIYNITY